MNKKNTLTRRQFLKLVGIGGIAVAPPLFFGYRFLKAAGGALPPMVDPYIDPPEISRPPKETASPILLLTNDSSANPFGRYLSEILLAEGVNCFQAARLDDVNPTTLQSYALILLTEGTLNTSQAKMLHTYVTEGGRLIAMRPSPEFATHLGLQVVINGVSEAYWQRDHEHPAAQGVSPEFMQFHGDADYYQPNDAQVVAWFTDTPAFVNRKYPAVVHLRYGQGQAAFCAFDIARSVVLTRQGNPAWTNQERDNREGVRAQDAFVDWVDLDRIAIPQADELMRLLSGLISYMLADFVPLPRLWYFPDGKKGMLIATGDSHQNPRTTIDTVLSQIEQYGGHMTIYYTPPSDNNWRRAARNVAWSADDVPILTNYVNRAEFPTPADVERWRYAGHEFAIHPYVESGLDAGWQEYWETFTGLGYGNNPRTVRTHRILWHGWVETARVQATYGIGLNLDFYHYGPAFQKKSGEWVYGHFTGSGLPMRFVDETGRILNIYQQNTQLVDEHLIQMPWGIGGSNIGGEAAVEISRQMLQSLDSAPAAIATQFHIDPFVYGGDTKPEVERWLEGTLELAAEYDIPIWSAEQWLDFTQIRQDANLDWIRWDQTAGQLKFDLKAEEAPEIQLTIRLPLLYNGIKLNRIDVDGKAVAVQQSSIADMDYGWFVIPAGLHHVVVMYK